MRMPPVPLKVEPSRTVRSIEEDVLDGLFEPPRQLPPKYFYDAEGSRLFDEICRTEEYYPTRAETALLERHAGEIIALTRPTSLVELGSGVGAKASLLLRACEACDVRAS